MSFIFAGGAVVVGFFTWVICNSTSRGDKHFKTIVPSAEPDKVCEDDYELVKTSAEKYMKECEDLVLKMTGEGFKVDEINIESFIVSCCNSNRDIMIDILSKKFPKLHFSKSQQVKEWEETFSSAYDCDTYYYKQTFRTIEINYTFLENE